MKKHSVAIPYDADMRAVMLAEYVIEHNATVRGTAKIFSVSKSTVHKDITERLKEVSLPLYERVGEVLKKNKEERHIRGGNATKEKYRKINSK